MGGLPYKAIKKNDLTYFIKSKAYKLFTSRYIINDKGNKVFVGLEYKKRGFFKQFFTLLRDTKNQSIIKNHTHHLKVKVRRLFSYQKTNNPLERGLNAMVTVSHNYSREGFAPSYSCQNIDFSTISVYGKMMGKRFPTPPIPNWLIDKGFYPLGYNIHLSAKNTYQIVHRSLRNPHS